MLLKHSYSVANCTEMFTKQLVFTDMSLYMYMQRAKKVLSDSPGLVDFAIRLVIFVLNLHNGQVLLFGKFKLQKDCNQSC